MGRNLYILATTVGGLALLSILISFTSIDPQPGDAAMWRMTGLAFLCLSLVIALAGVLSALFEQAERRATHEREQRRQARRRS